MKGIAQSFKLPNGNAVEGDLVVTTTQVMAALMCASRSINSWDVVVTKQTVGTQRVLYFDKRAQGTLDSVTVLELVLFGNHESNTII